MAVSTPCLWFPSAIGRLCCQPDPQDSVLSPHLGHSTGRQVQLLALPKGHNAQPAKVKAAPCPPLQPLPAAPTHSPPVSEEAPPREGALGWRLDLSPWWLHPKSFPTRPRPLPDGGRWQWDGGLERCKTRQGDLPGRPLFGPDFVPGKLLNPPASEDKMSVSVSFISKPCTLPENSIWFCPYSILSLGTNWCRRPDSPLA